MRKKTAIFFICFCLGMGLLAVRLFFLQVYRGNYYQRLADKNRVQKIGISGPRGVIFDRHLEILARNIPVFKQVGDEKKVISREEAFRLQIENKENDFFIDYIRDYPQGDIFAHIIGYLGEISEKEIQEDRCKNQKCAVGDWVGRSAIEQFYENSLKGKPGGILVETDTAGKILRVIGKEEPVSGNNLTLAVDADLQRAAVVAFNKVAGNREKGGVIVTNYLTGEVLALYSSPSFDPNYFVSRRSETAVAELLSDYQNVPLLNRIISGVYPPGSTFKIVTSVAGLEEKKITKNTLISDPGVIFAGGSKFANWYWTSYGKTEGEINVVRAIQRSTDTYFYRLGEMLGAEKLAYWAEKFNLGKTFGIDLFGEVSGLVPSPEWKKKNKGENWFLGNTYHFSIGQGDLALTPLGVNLMTAVIANNGKICRPRMVKLDSDEKIVCRDIGIRKESIEIVKEGLISACSAGGTASTFVGFHPAGGRVACKTGTAEYFDLETGKTKTHSWFTAFIDPEEKLSEGEGKWFGRREIVITVFVEGGGEGSSVAAPITKEILEEYFLTE